MINKESEKKFSTVYNHNFRKLIFISLLNVERAGKRNKEMQGKYRRKNIYINRNNDLNFFQ